MERFTVFHLLPEFTRDVYTRIETSLSRYTLVATVEAECVGQVFQLTNHGVPGQVDNWTDGPEVIELFTPKSRTRSTSVGDVVCDELGHFHRCAPIGWQALTMDDSSVVAGIR